MELFSFLQARLSPFVSETLSYPEKDYDILKVYTESSSLYEEVSILISHQKKSGFFQQSHSLEELKFDFANNCGVLYRVNGDEHGQRNILRTFGNEGILSEKNWL